jgi:hypothetical protein
VGSAATAWRSRPEGKLVAGGWSLVVTGGSAARGSGEAESASGGSGAARGWSLVVEDNVGDDFVEGGAGFELLHLAEGLEAGLHEIGESADLAVVDLMVGERQGDGVEVVEDGGVVFHVDEADEGTGAWCREDGADASYGAEVAFVVVAEFAAVVGGHGAAGSVEVDAAATAEGVALHWDLLAKKRLAEKRLAKKRLAKKRLAEKRLAKKRLAKRVRGRNARAQSRGGAVSRGTFSEGLLAKGV